MLPVSPLPVQNLVVLILLVVTVGYLLVLTLIITSVLGGGGGLNRAFLGLDWKCLLTGTTAHFVRRPRCQLAVARAVAERRFFGASRALFGSDFLGTV